MGSTVSAAAREVNGSSEVSNGADKATKPTKETGLVREMVKAIKELYKLNILINIKTHGKDFYYMNPNYVRDEDKKYDELRWLFDIFESEMNMDLKELV